MTIQTRCPHCKSTFRVPDNAVGKNTKCTNCKQPFTVAAMIAPATSEKWHAKSSDGSEYGPADKSEIDQWVTEGRITHEWQLLRSGDASWAWAYDFYPELLPAAESIVSIQTDATSAVPSVSGNAGSAKGNRPTFRARQYPAMRFVSYFFYGLAVLTALSLLLSLVGIAMLTGGSMITGAAAPSEMAAAMMGSSIIGGILMFVFTLLYHGMFIAMFVYAAESVRVVLDIQQNTQETAHYTKYGFA